MKKKLRLILASGSASRKMILNKLATPYEVIVPDIDETVLPGEEVVAHVLRLSKEKALKVAGEIGGDVAALIVGCDSVCVLNGEIMSKPENHAVAVIQLRASSGKVVYFYSGLALYNAQTKHLQQEVVRTEVHFKHLSDALIEAYLHKDQPYHCAGSIKAEGLGVMLIEKMIADDPNSLVGLPLIALIGMLEHEGFFADFIAP
jgi:septum formation protein